MPLKNRCPAPILCALYSLNTLTFASEPLDGDHLEEEGHGGGRARVSAERDEPLSSADLPRLRPRARFLPSSRKGKGLASAPGSLQGSPWRGLEEAWAHHQVFTWFTIVFAVSAHPDPPIRDGFG